MGQGPSYDWIRGSFIKMSPWTWVGPGDLLDLAEKCVQSPPNSTAQIEPQQSGVALFPQENPNRAVPEGRLRIAHRFNGGTSGGPLSPKSRRTAEALSEDVFQPSLRDWIWKKGRVFPPLK